MAALAIAELSRFGEADRCHAFTGWIRTLLARTVPASAFDRVARQFTNHHTVHECTKSKCPCGCEKGFGLISIEAWEQSVHFFTLFEGAEASAATPPNKKDQTVVFPGNAYYFVRYHMTNK